MREALTISYRNSVFREPGNLLTVNYKAKWQAAYLLPRTAQNTLYRLKREEQGKARNPGPRQDQSPAGQTPNPAAPCAGWECNVVAE